MGKIIGSGPCSPPSPFGYFPLGGGRFIAIHNLEMISPASVDARFRLSADQAEDLAASYGTPLYVIDEAHFRARVRRYLAAFRAVWPRSELAYASKANSTLAVLAMAHQEGCVIDVASEGELRAALAAGVPAERCHFHGNNKSREEIGFALGAEVGAVVVDNFVEIEELGTRNSDLGASRLDGSSPAPPPSLRATSSAPLEVTPSRLRRSPPAPQGGMGGGGSSTSIVLRLAPGVDPVTHHKISTGQADTKFGFNIADGSAEKALVRCLELGLPVAGFHCHVGSQDRKSTRLNSSHLKLSRMPSSA